MLQAARTSCYSVRHSLLQTELQAGLQARRSRRSDADDASSLHIPISQAQIASQRTKQIAAVGTDAHADGADDVATASKARSQPPPPARPQPTASPPQMDTVYWSPAIYWSPWPEQVTADGEDGPSPSPSPFAPFQSRALSLSRVFSVLQPPAALGFGRPVGSHDGEAGQGRGATAAVKVLRAPPPLPSPRPMVARAKSALGLL